MSLLVAISWKISIYKKLFSTSIPQSVNVPLKGQRHRQGISIPRLDKLKDLYFMIHNLECFHRDVLPEVEPTLRELISKALEDATRRGRCRILDIGSYSPQKLEQFYWKNMTLVCNAERITA